MIENYAGAFLILLEMTVSKFLSNYILWCHGHFFQENSGASTLPCKHKDIKTGPVITKDIKELRNLWGASLCLYARQCPCVHTIIWMHNPGPLFFSFCLCFFGPGCIHKWLCKYTWPGTISYSLIIWAHVSSFTPFSLFLE